MNTRIYEVPLPDDGMHEVRIRRGRLGLFDLSFELDGEPVDARPVRIDPDESSEERGAWLLPGVETSLAVWASDD